MDNQTAINVLEKYTTKDVGIEKIVIEALKKQIPRKPEYEGDGYSDGILVYDTWICPNCGARYEVDYDDYDFCPKCGQAIDLSRGVCDERCRKDVTSCRDWDTDRCKLHKK